MKEVKDPRKDWVKYYLIVLLVMLVFNAVIYPRIQEASVKEVSYNVFMDLTEQQKIDKVQVDPNQILFTEKDSKTVYKTGIMDDPNLTERLYKAGVDFRTDIQRVSSPLETFLFSWVIPILMFVVLGQFMSRKLSGKIGGGANSMMFGMGKSNAKIYVHSTEGISFDDVAGEDEAGRAGLGLQQIFEPGENGVDERRVAADADAASPEGGAVGIRCDGGEVREDLLVGVELDPAGECFLLFHW